MDFSDGKLELVLGTMFSGKTTFMLSKISFFSNLNFKILYINTDFDNRNNDTFYTHNPFINTSEYNHGDNIKKNVKMIKTNKLSDIPYNNYDIVIIDEAHFFDDLVEYTKLLLENKKYVIVGSLIGDFNGNKFGHACELIPICDDIHRLHAYCGVCSKSKKCKIAIYSKRISYSKETIEIGGSDKYIPVCREHYQNINNYLENIVINNNNNFTELLNNNYC